MTYSKKICVCYVVVQFYPLFKCYFYYKIIHYHNHNMYTNLNDVIFHNMSYVT